MDPNTFRHTFLPLTDRLFRLALRLLRSREEAEDVVQEVFLKLLKMDERLDEYHSPAALAMTMARNTSLDRLRTRHTVPDDNDLPHHPATDPDPVTELDMKEKAAIVRTIIDNLDEPARTVIHMRDVEGAPFDEIAEMTGMTVNNVRVVLSRTRKKVREMFLKMTDHGNR